MLLSVLFACVPADESTDNAGSTDTDTAIDTGDTDVEPGEFTVGRAEKVKTDASAPDRLTLVELPDGIAYAYADKVNNWNYEIAWPGQPKEQPLALDELDALSSDGDVTEDEFMVIPLADGSVGWLFGPGDCSKLGIGQTSPPKTETVFPLAEGQSDAEMGRWEYDDQWIFAWVDEDNDKLYYYSGTSAEELVASEQTKRFDSISSVPVDAGDFLVGGGFDENPCEDDQLGFWMLDKETLDESSSCGPEKTLEGSYSTQSLGRGYGDNRYALMFAIGPDNTQFSWSFMEYDLPSGDLLEDVSLDGSVLVEVLESATFFAGQRAHGGWLFVYTDANYAAHALWWKDGETLPADYPLGWEQDWSSGDPVTLVRDDGFTIAGIDDVDAIWTVDITFE